MAENLKTALIALLSVTMALLLLAFFAITTVSDALSFEDVLFEFFRRDEKTELSPSDSEERTLSTPCQIALLLGNGALYTPIYAEEFGEMYRLTSRIAEEALGSASEVREISENEYLLSLINTGFLYKYDFPTPFYLIFPQISALLPETDIDVKSLLICLDEGEVFLILHGDDGVFYRFNTLSDAAYLKEVCDTATANGTVSAVTNIDNITYDSILPDSAFTMPEYKILTYEFEGETASSIMTELNMNPYLSSVYRDGDNTIYMEDTHRITVHSDGHISYISAEDGAGISLSLDSSWEQREQFSQLCTQAGTKVLDLWSKLVSSNISLSLSDIKLTEDGFTLFFEAYIGGCLINTEEHSAAAIEVKNGKITAISLHPLAIEEGEQVQILPIKQAAVTVEELSYVAVQYNPSEGVLTPVTVCVADGAREAR